MPPKSLHKVAKSITRKIGKHGPKKSTALHGNSRDAKRLQRASARDSKVAEKIYLAAKSRDPYLARIAHFHALAASAPKREWSDEDLKDTVEQFIRRRDVALGKLEGERRAGRPMSKEEERVRARKENEENEFESGFWVVDLRDEENRRKLCEWKGDWGGMNVLKFVRVRKDGKVVGGTWPPR